jgi:hypothetical protein
MSRLNKRRDPIVVDTVKLASSIEGVLDQYTPVTRAGVVATENGDAYGITMTSGEANHHVQVCRLGFCPVRANSATTVDGEKIQLAVGTGGALKQAGTGHAVIAVSEEAAASDGDQIGAWVDCLSPNRAQPA